MALRSSSGSCGFKTVPTVAMGHCPVSGNVYGEVLGCKGDANDEGRRLAASNAAMEFLVNMSIMLRFFLKWKSRRDIWLDFINVVIPFPHLFATVFTGCHYLFFRESVIINLLSKGDEIRMHDLNVCISISKKEARI